MKKSLYSFVLFGILFGFFKLEASENLSIFGYVQPYVTNFSSSYPDSTPPGESNYTYNHAGVAQFNLFIANKFSNDLSAMVNLEITNNYSSNKGFGNFNLQEAFLKWEANELVNIKFGMFLPKFNQMFEIYNRTPLLPYLNRPKLYETSSGNLVDIFDILPQKGLVQISGNLNLSEESNLAINYALYINHPTNGYISSPTNDLIPGYVAFGQSAVDFFGYGARIGLKYEGLSLGFSITSDKDNKRNYKSNIANKYKAYLMDAVSDTSSQTFYDLYSSDQTNLGDISRLRIGADFSFKYKGLTLTGEYVKVDADENAKTVSNPNTTVADQLKLWNNENAYFFGKTIDKKFYFVSLQYDYEDYFVYTMYDYLDDGNDPFFFGEEGYSGFSLGAGWNIDSNLVIKGQFTKNTAKYNIGDNFIVKFNDMSISLGCSIMF